MPDVHPRPTRDPALARAASPARPTRGGRRTREDVVDTALALLQERGLPDLTMRHIARAVGVQPSALYWHVRDKQELLAAVSERILAPAAGGTPGEGAPSSIPWEDTVRGAATDLRDALLAVRDGAEVVSSSLALGLVALPLAGRTTPALVDEGATGRTCRTLAETLGHFVLGHVFHEQQRRAAAEAGVIADGAGAPLGVDDARGVDGPPPGVPGAHGFPGAPPGAPRAPGATGGHAPEADPFADGVDLLVAGTAVLLAMDTSA